MGMSGALRQKTDDAESTATIHEAIERGVNLLDTGDFYGFGHNELLVGKAIADRRDKVVLSVKFNGLRSPDGKFLGFDSQPEAVKNFIGYSLTRLGVDYIDIYRPSRLDPKVPIEETVGAIGELVQAGLVRYIGLSEVGAETIRRAHAVHPIADVQLEYSLMSRKPEETIVPVLDELGIAMTAYAVLSHGLLVSNPKPAEGGMRAHLPRLQGENFERNRRLVAALTAVAEEKGVTTSQLAIAWVLAKGANLIPVIGVSKRARLAESLEALNIELSPEDVVRIEQAVPADQVAGTRYAAPLMKMLDSER